VIASTNRSLGEWSKDVADISVEPISLVERWRRLLSERGRWGGRGVGDSLEVSREDIVDASGD
jgi:hypothetical protein